MDNNTLSLFVVLVLAILVIGAFAVYQQRIKVGLKGPLGMSLNIDGSNENPPVLPAIDVKNAKSNAGGLVADDQTGRGMRAEGLDVKDDILLSSKPPAKDSDSKKV